MRPGTSLVLFLFPRARGRKVKKGMGGGPLFRIDFPEITTLRKENARAYSIKEGIVLAETPPGHPRPDPVHASPASVHRQRPEPVSA